MCETKIGLWFQHLCILYYENMYISAGCVEFEMKIYRLENIIYGLRKVSRI